MIGSAAVVRIGSGALRAQREARRHERLLDAADDHRPRTGVAHVVVGFVPGNLVAWSIQGACPPAIRPVRRDKDRDGQTPVEPRAAARDGLGCDALGCFRPGRTLLNAGTGSDGRAAATARRTGRAPRANRPASPWPE